MPQLFKVAQRFLLIGLLFAASSSFGQQNTSSPYSRFGLGDLSESGLANGRAMGGWTIAWRDSLNLKMTNPALVADLRRTAFHMGLNGNFVNRTNGDLSQRTSNSNLAFIALGFPIGKKMGMGISLTPFSSVGYEINDEIDLDSLGMAEVNYLGFGGLNQASLAIGRRMFKGFTLGAKANYNFGTLDRIVVVDFDTSTFYDSRLVNRTQVGDFNLELGGVYARALTDEVKLSLAAAYTLNSDLSATRSRLLYTFSTSAAIEQPKDTSINERDQEGVISLPAQVRLGFGLAKGQDWGLGAQVNLRDWSSYQNFDQKDSLASGFAFSAGGYITPNPDAIGKYWKAVTYRFGAHYNQTYLQLRNNQLTDLGISFGVSLPLRRSFSRVNLAVTAGRRGTTASNLIQEDYVKFSIGFTLNDKWFNQRRID